MVYQDNPAFRYKVLAQGEYRGREFRIVSYGTHPCIYLKIHENEKYYGRKYDDIPLDVHGSLTFSEMIPYGNKKFLSEGHWIGWDYAHAGDSYGTILGERKYAVVELLEEMRNAVEELEKIM